MPWGILASSPRLAKLMRRLLPQAGSRIRVLSTRALVRFGFTDETFLLIPAILIGVISAAGAVVVVALDYPLSHQGEDGALDDRAVAAGRAQDTTRGGAGGRAGGRLTGGRLARP